MKNLFFAAITPLVLNSPSARACPEFSDLDFVRMGIQRVLEASPSGPQVLSRIEAILNPQSPAAGVI